MVNKQKVIELKPLSKKQLELLLNKVLAYIYYRKQ